MVIYDFSEDKMQVNEVTYDLKPYRKWLLSNHETLVINHFIKSLTVNGKQKRYFDWQTIYHTAFVYHFIHDYIKQLKTNLQ
jgi:hypothetical protein